MGVEIERKFLVNTERWRPIAPGIRYMQGYLCADAGRTVRIRVAGDTAWLTVKGPTQGSVRSEFEYEIPADDGREMLKALSATPPVVKTRYKQTIGDHVWEIDIFEGDNAGLVLAEIELASEDERFELPEWVGLDVTGDARYQNSSLARRPFKSW